MATPFDIQRYPQGLVDLLGMKATGNTPAQLSQQTGGVVELADYYLWDRVQANVGQSPVAIGVVGFLANSTGATVVPQGELWVLYDATLRVPAIAAATALTLTLVIQRSFAGTSAWFALTEQQRLAAGQGCLVGPRFDRPLLLRPGDTFGTYCSDITGVPGQQAFTTVSYAVLKI